jgi:hypothetical protein
VGSFRGAVISNHLFAHDDTSLPRRLFFFTRFSRAADFGHVWMLIKGYINHLCGETPNDLRMRVPAPTTSFAGVEVTLTETQCKATINALSPARQDARNLEDWLEMQSIRFVMLGIYAYSYNVVVRVTSQSF